MVMFRDDGEGLLRVDLPGEPAPHRSDRASAFEILSVAGVELLPVEYRNRHVLWPGKSLAFGNAVKGIPLACGVEERRQRVRLPTSERRAELENPVVARLSGERRQDLIKEFLEVGCQVGRPEEGLRVPVHNRNVGVARGNGSEVDGEDRLRKRAPFHIGVQFHEVGPGAKGSRAHSIIPYAPITPIPVIRVIFGSFSGHSMASTNRPTRTRCSWLRPFVLALPCQPTR